MPDLTPLTVVIPTYQRRQPLLRLLEALGREVAASPRWAEGVSVIVVVDGSTDGTADAARACPLLVPLVVLEQPNRGLASARNAGWRAADEGLVLFLDDDLVPTEGWLERHRAAHRDGEELVLIGPCVLRGDDGTTAGSTAWWTARYGSLAEHGLRSFDEFSAANTSMPRAVLQRLGGFDEAFVGYGREDYELGLRLLDDGVQVRFDPEARTVHEQRRSAAELCRLRREEGRSFVMFADLHPGRADEVVGAPLPPLPVRRAFRLLARAAPVLGRTADLAEHAVARAEADGRRPRWPATAASVCFAAGVVLADESARVTPRLAVRAWRRAVVKDQRG